MHHSFQTADHAQTNRNNQDTHARQTQHNTHTTAPGGQHNNHPLEPWPQTHWDHRSSAHQRPRPQYQRAEKRSTGEVGSLGHQSTGLFHTDNIDITYMQHLLDAMAVMCEMYSYVLLYICHMFLVKFAYRKCDQQFYSWFYIILFFKCCAYQTATIIESLHSPWKWVLNTLETRWTYTILCFMNFNDLLVTLTNSTRKTVNKVIKTQNKLSKCESAIEFNGLCLTLARPGHFS